MHSDSSPLPPRGTDLGALEIAVSPEANDRYWRGAGIDHPARGAGLLYPPMAVNFTILLVQQTVADGLLHTWGRVGSHAAATAGGRLTVTGRVTGRFEKRARDYFVVASEVRTAEATLLWTAETELAASRLRPGAGDTAGIPRGTLQPPAGAAGATRGLTLTADLLRAYSRAGNFHSDDDAAREMGLPGMVAMGMQTVGPAYGILLDSWGNDILERGALEVRFFGLVREGDTVEASVASEGDAAAFDIRNLTRGVSTAAGAACLA